MVRERIEQFLNLKRFGDIKRKYTYFWAVTILLCALLITSFLRAFWGYGSLTVFFVRRYPDLMPYFLLLAQIINLDAVLKVGEAVGICSFLIAWIYASLDKKCLGFHYSELLTELYPGYHLSVLLHLISFAVCMWMVKIERLEPAVLALTIVLADNFLQWKTLKNLILHSKSRAKIAIDRWNRLLDENWQEEHAQRDLLQRENQQADVPKRKNNALLYMIYNIADALAIDEGGNYESMRKLLARAMAQYIESLYPRTPHEWASTLREVSRIWSRVQEKVDPDEREALVTGILHICAWKACQGALSMGYLLWRYDYYTKQGTVNTTSLQMLSKEITVLIQQQFDHSSYVHSTPFYMESAFTLLAWMHFMCGNTGLDGELFKLSPTEHPTKRDRAMLEGFGQTVFTQESCKSYLNLVMGQIF